MERYILLAGALLVCLLGGFPLISGRFVVETNSIAITSPEHLKGSYDSAIGNFGVPQYGGTLSGTIVYATENSRACEDFGTKDKFRSHPGGLPVIVVVDRGGIRLHFPALVWCLFVFYVSADTYTCMYNVIMKVY